MRRFIAFLPLLATACLPYAVGNSTYTAPVGQAVPTQSSYFVTRRYNDDSTNDFPLFGIDPEFRYGINEQSDVGVRLPGVSGLVLSYKHRLDKPWHESSVSTAFMVGGGVIGWGGFGELEATGIVSLNEHGFTTPYAGFRLMDLITVGNNTSGMGNAPVLGGFLGTRFGSPDDGVSFEVGVYYDKFGQGSGTPLAIVPSFTLHGAQLIRKAFR